MRAWGRIACWSALALACTAGAYAAGPSAGYLAPGEFDVTHVLEPAPKPGDPRYDSDRLIFRATRSLVGTPRWALATRDVETDVPALLHDFSCSVGVTLTTQNAPRLVTVLLRAGADTGRQTGLAKDYYKRQRPFLIDSGPVCQPESDMKDDSGNVSYDYPSGHTTWGWTWALVLSALEPDHASAILARGRAYGDSRFVCGAHNESAVEAGFLAASATMAAVAAKPAYQADLAAARAELAALRAAGPAPADCPAEAALVKERVLPKLGRPH